MDIFAFVQGIIIIIITDIVKNIYEPYILF